MEKDIKNGVETEQNDSFAMELLRDYAKQAKRWFMILLKTFVKSKK